MPRMPSSSSILHRDGVDSSSSPVSGSPNHRSNTADADSKAPPRPANAFILFRSHFLESCKADTIHQHKVSQQAGVAWKDLSDGEKAEWKAKAEQVKVEHLQKYPGYSFSPRKRDASSSKHSKAALNKPSSNVYPNGTVPQPSTHSHGGTSHAHPSYHHPTTAVSPHASDILSGTRPCRPTTSGAYTGAPGPSYSGCSYPNSHYSAPPFEGPFGTRLHFNYAQDSYRGSDRADAEYYQDSGYYE